MPVAQTRSCASIFPELLLFPPTLSLTMWEESHLYTGSSMTYVSKDHLNCQVRPSAGAAQRDKLVENFVGCFAKDK